MPKKKQSSFEEVTRLRVDEAAEYARVSPKTIRVWLKQGLKFTQKVPRGLILIRQCDLEDFLSDKNKQTP